MKGNGLERDSLDGVIKDLERLEKKWQSSKNQFDYPVLRDAIWYLKELKYIQERPLEKRLIDLRIGAEMLQPTNVIKVQGEYIYIVGKDSGFLHPQDRGLWQGYKVTWDWHRGEWHFGDDDIWLTDGKQIAAREIGWNRRREQCKGDR